MHHVDVVVDTTHPPCPSLAQVKVQQLLPIAVYVMASSISRCPGSVPLKGRGGILLSIRLQRKGAPMQRAVTVLQILWVVLMAILAALILNNAISGIAIILYGLVVLAITFAEMALRSRIRKP